MKKVLEIESCLECLFCRGVNDGHYCWHKGFENRKVEAIIPDWCPLPDSTIAFMRDDTTNNS